MDGIIYFIDIGVRLIGFIIFIIIYFVAMGCFLISVVIPCLCLPFSLSEMISEKTEYYRRKNKELKNEEV